MHRALLLTLFCMFPALPVQAQWTAADDAHRAKIGIVGGINFSWHQGTFTSRDAQFDCCSFAGGNGLGRSAGLRMFIPLSADWSLRAGTMFEQLNGEYPVEYESYPVLDARNDVVLLSLQQEMEVTLEAFTVEVTASYALLGRGLYVAAGPSYSILMSKHQEQRETILSPSDLAFLDGGGRSHLLIDSEIPDAEHFLALRLAAGGLFPLHPLFYANPEVLFSVPLSKVRARGDWSISGFEVTLGILLVL